MRAVDKRVSALEDALQSSRMEHLKLHERTLHMEAYSRRINLKLEGIAEARGENCMAIACETIDKMGLDSDDVNIVKAHRVGQFRPKQSSPREIIVQFANYSEHEKIWEKRSSLRGTNIWMTEDFPAEIEARRKVLWPYLRAARMGDPDKPGNRISAFMRIDKLILNNQIYTTDSVQNIPASIKSRVEHPPARIKSGSVTIFFTKESKLSNFYPCQFEIEGIRFSSVEKYLCYKNALLFDSRDVASDLLTINEPKDLKRRVKRLPNFDADRWATEAGSILMNSPWVQRGHCAPPPPPGSSMSGIILFSGPH